MAGAVIAAIVTASAATDVLSVPPASAGRLARYLLTGGGLLALVAAIITWAVMRAVLSPIKKVTAQAGRITQAELGRPILIKGSREAEELARVLSDISAAAKRLIDDAAEERMRLSTVLATLTDGVIMTDGEARLMLANRAAASLFGFQEDRFRGGVLIEAVRDHEVDELVKRCLRTGTVQTAQLEIGAGRRFVRAVASPVAGPRPTGCVLLTQDLTELRSLQTMRRELIGNISHDLRTPLAGIKVMVETLRDGAFDDRPAAFDFLDRIDSETARLTRMLEELTELSRIETGKVELKKEPVDLNALIDDVIVQMAPLAERQGITLSVSHFQELPAVQADRERIRGALVNLVHNAVKFNRAGGHVKVATSSNPDSVIVSVIDDGVGISREDLPHVFERFYKSDKSRGGEGSGMGLAIAKHVIQIHGGQIHVESEDGKGSTFSFSLPLNLGKLENDRQL
jgi:two-component system phosphate regulon sensor histidine kinase PhoR